ncbi:MAG TPA: GAF domain-containing protein [Thermoleophilaceae bacterium]
MASVGFFLLTAAIPIRGDVIPIVLLGCAYVYVVGLAARRRGPLYAVPLAIAGGVGFDSFYIPPTREFGAGHWQNWLVVFIYIALGVLIGVIGAQAQRRAEVSERERGRLADEQAALRRVAMLVAEDAPWTELFGAVAREVGTLLRADFSAMARFEDNGVFTVATWAADGEHPPVPERWEMQEGDPATTIAETRRAARWNDWSDVPGPIAEFIRQLGIRCSVGTPIVVQGRLWGALAIHSRRPVPLPSSTEERMAQFTDLVGTAVANAEARAEAKALADEQAALRRVATLVAREAPQAEIFNAIAKELAGLLGAEEMRMLRYDGDESAVVVASSGAVKAFATGDSYPLAGENVTSLIFRSGSSARIDGYEHASGAIAETARASGLHSVVGTPIWVEGRLWGAMVAATDRDEQLPADTESRLSQFTELLATAISNTETRGEVERLAEQQAALRRVATLVAREAPPADVFEKVVEQLANVLGDVDCSLWRDDHDGTATMVAVWGERLSSAVGVGNRMPVDGNGVVATVLREGRPFRVRGYAHATGAIAEHGHALGIRSAVGCPILVRGEIWGAVGAARYVQDAFAPDVESHIARFAELVATAIANADARTEVERLAKQEAALSRVATLVAEGAPPSAVLDAVAGEMQALLDADQVALNRFESADEMTVLAHRGLDVGRTPVGSRVSTAGESVTAVVRRTGRPARMDNYDGVEGAIAELARDTGLRCSVSAPIVVDGRLWGLITASWKTATSPPADTEQRMVQFAQLLDTAIANADSREQLMASRARLVTEADHARRQVVRDLHDGAQQRLVHAIVTLKLAQRALHEGDGKTDALVDEALEHAERGNAELRELAHGILPSVLTRGGLRAGVDTVVQRLDLPVRVDIPDDRFPADIEASAYFVVAEALTNVVKHSHAESAEVKASVRDGSLYVEVRDDGVGGADDTGHGLVGMNDRVTALGGRVTIESPTGAGTVLVARLPLSGG